MSTSILIRPATPEDARGLATVRIATWRATYLGLVPADYLMALNVDQDALRWHERLSQLAQMGSCGFMAVEQPGEHVVGYCLAGPERSGDAEFQGEIYALYVLPDYQRRGLGKALVRAAAAWLRERGYERIIIYVLRGNHSSRQFYEVLGGVLARDKEVEIGGAPLAEVGYGYDLDSLLLQRDGDAHGGA